MKSARAGLPRDVALPGPYHSFFSFPVTKGGYSFLFPGRAGRSECAVSLVRWLALLLFIGLLTALTRVTDGRNIRRCALNYLPVTAIEIGNELQFP